LIQDSPPPSTYKEKLIQSQSHGKRAIVMDSYSASIYEIAVSALRPQLRDTVSYAESLGLVILSGKTAAVNRDGQLESIPLDIMCSPVNLKAMWGACTDPVAIVFREIMDDWYAVIPRDNTLGIWDIRPVPGKGHDMHRGRALAEQAIRCDFDLPGAKVVDFTECA
jgi:hypothetical protein